MGEVYRARDPKLNRDVAIKVLPPGGETIQIDSARFVREARVLASLNHPDIVHIHGFEESATWCSTAAISRDCHQRQCQRYSERSATVGSTLVARSAGTYEARSDEAIKIREAVARTAGSTLSRP